jgi:hypothetical protein
MIRKVLSEGFKQARRNGFIKPATGKTLAEHQTFPRKSIHPLECPYFSLLNAPPEIEADDANLTRSSRRMPMSASGSIVVAPCPDCHRTTEKKGADFDCSCLQELRAAFRVPLRHVADPDEDKLRAAFPK